MSAIIDDFAMIDRVCTPTPAGPTKRKSISMTTKKPSRNLEVITPTRYNLGDVDALRAYALRMIAVGNTLLDMIAEETARQIDDESLCVGSDRGAVCPEMGLQKGEAELAAEAQK